MWDLPGLGTEPGSPELARGVFTTEPPGRPQHSWLGEVIAAAVAC